MSVSDSFATPRATFTFLRAAEELGYKEIDLNGEEQIGNFPLSGHWLCEEISPGAQATDIGLLRSALTYIPMSVESLNYMSYLYVKG